MERAVGLAVLLYLCTGAGARAQEGAPRRAPAVSIRQAFPVTAEDRDAIRATTCVPNAEYPRIHPDLRVTFKLRAPDAKRVALQGGDGLVNGSLDLTRGEDGIWSVTTPPAVPGFHYY
jgi:hypothetical protein